jgi:gamma-glutamyl-gamma-aminobutyrate hydrolase PuuD
MASACQPRANVMIAIAIFFFLPDTSILASTGRGLNVERTVGSWFNAAVKRRAFVVLAAVVILGTGIGATMYRWLSGPAAPVGAPVIGVLLDTTWPGTLGLTQAAYERALRRVGAATLAVDPEQDEPMLVLDTIDGLLLTGGGDVDPRLYSGGIDSAQRVDRVRDDFEIELIRRALARDLPILGICRGIQILNVAHGGTLKDLREDEELANTHSIDLNSFRAHEVTVAPGSALAAIVGDSVRTVNSFHGQAVDRLGESLTVAASSPDGIIEAVERRDRRFVLATQWHPEIHALEDEKALAIFQAFVESAGYERDSTRH